MNQAGDKATINLLRRWLYATPLLLVYLGRNRMIGCDFMLKKNSKHFICHRGVHMLWIFSLRKLVGQKCQHMLFKIWLVASPDATKCSELSIPGCGWSMGIVVTIDINQLWHATNRRSKQLLKAFWKLKDCVDTKHSTWTFLKTRKYVLRN